MANADVTHYHALLLGTSDSKYRSAVNLCQVRVHGIFRQGSRHSSIHRRQACHLQHALKNWRLTHLVHSTTAFLALPSRDSTPFSTSVMTAAVPWLRAFAKLRYVSVSQPTISESLVLRKSRRTPEEGHDANDKDPHVRWDNREVDELCWDEHEPVDPPMHQWPYQYGILRRHTSYEEAFPYTPIIQVPSSASL